MEMEIFHDHHADNWNSIWKSFDDAISSNKRLACSVVDRDKNKKRISGQLGFSNNIILPVNISSRLYLESIYPIFPDLHLFILKIPISSHAMVLFGNQGRSYQCKNSFGHTKKYDKNYQPVFHISKSDKILLAQRQIKGGVGYAINFKK
jgi:hypothetical protein